VSFVFRCFCGCHSSVGIYFDMSFLIWYLTRSVHKNVICLNGILFLSGHYKKNSPAMWFFLCSVPIKTGHDTTVWIWIVYVHGAQGGKVNILGGHSISHSEQKSV
jgi:hypothetical protein